MAKLPSATPNPDYKSLPDKIPNQIPNQNHLVQIIRWQVQSTKDVLKAIVDGLKSFNLVESPQVMAKKMTYMHFVVTKFDDIIERLIKIQMDDTRAKKLQNHVNTTIGSINHTLGALKTFTNLKVEDLDMKGLKKMTDQIIFICELPGAINKRLARIKDKEIDTKRIEDAKKSLDKVFGKNGLMKSIQDICKSIDNFKGMSFLKFILLLGTLNALVILMQAIAVFAAITMLFAVPMRMATVAIALWLKVLNELGKLYQRISSIKLGAILLLPFKIWMMRKVLHSIVDLGMEMAGLVPVAQFGQVAVLAIVPLQDIMKRLVQIINMLAEVKLTALIGCIAKIALIGVIIRSISRFVVAPLKMLTAGLFTMIAGIITLALTKKLLKQFVQIVEIISKVKLTKLIGDLLKLKLLNKLAHKIIPLIYKIQALGMSSMVAAAAIPGLLVARIVIGIFIQIIQILKKAWVGIFFTKRMHGMICSTKLIRRLIRGIAKLGSTRTMFKAMVKAKLAQMVFKSFASLIITLVILTPLMIVFLALSPIILLIFFAFAIVFRVLIKILAKLILNPAVILTVLVLTGIILLLVIFGLALVALGFIALLIAKNILALLFFFAILLTVVLVLAAFGALVAFFAPLILAAVLGAIAVTAAVLCLLLIALALNMIAEIELDIDKIKDNVRKIVEAVFAVIEALFLDEGDMSDNSPGGFAKLLMGAVMAIPKILLIFLTVPLLAAAVFVVLMVLIIAALLRLLQTLDLNVDKILENVDMVFKTVNEIMDRILGYPEEGWVAGQSGGLIGLLAGVFCPDLAKVLDAIVGIALVALYAAVILCVLLLAGMLKLIEFIELHPDKILKTVDAIFDTINHIMDRILGFPEDGGWVPGQSAGILGVFVGLFFPDIAKVLDVIVGIVLVVLYIVVIVCVLMLASMLKLLELIDLDPDKIIKEVDAVFDVINHIMDRLLGFPEDGGWVPGQSAGILGIFVGMFFPDIAKVLDAIVGIVLVVLYVVLIVCVLMLAGMLRLLQEINLDSKQIIKIVDAICDACEHIVGRITGPSENHLDGSGAGPLGALIGFFYPAYGKIVDMIISIVYVALAIVAILLVNVLAQHLKSIQEIQINPKLAQQKAMDIFDACEAIMAVIYERAELALNGGQKNIFKSLLGWVAPGLKAMMDVWEVLSSVAKLAIIKIALGAVCQIAEDLQKINEVQVDAQAAQSRVKQILDVAGDICNRIFSAQADITFPTPPAERKSVLDAFLDFAFRGSMTPEDQALKAAMKKVEGLECIKSAVGALTSILDGMKKIMEVKWEYTPEQVSNRIGDAMSIAKDVAQQIFGASGDLKLPEPSKDAIQGALIDLGFDHWYGSSVGEKALAAQKAQLNEAMHRVQCLGQVASAIGTLSTIIDGIGSVMKFNNPPDAKTLHERVKNVLKSAQSVTEAIFTGTANTYGGTSSSEFSEKKKQVLDMLKFNQDMMAELVKVCSSINNFTQSASVNETELANAEKRITNAVNIIGRIVKAMDGIKLSDGGKGIRANCEIMDRISRTVGSFVKVEDRDVKNAKNITDNYIKFLQQVDRTDIKKLQHTDYLMRSWASISRDLKGDFQGLARTINAQIMPMLDKLNKTMEEATKCQNEILSELSKPVTINGGGGGVGASPSGSMPAGSSTSGSGTSGLSGSGTSVGAGAVQPAGSTPKAVSSSSVQQIRSGNTYRIVATISSAEQV